MDEVCCCGHVYVEHQLDGRDCDVDECPCLVFEAG
jgi:hypothetical protein